MNRYILATHPNMQEVWVFTVQGLNPKPVPKEKWERRFLNLSETPSVHPFVRCRFWKKRTMGVQRSFILTEVYTVPGVLKKKQTLLSLVLVTKPSSLLLLVIYVWLIPAASKLRKSTIICKNHCRALNSHGA